MNTLLTALTGGLVALGGLLNGWLANRQGAKRDHSKYDHERKMAEEVRRQERLDQAYIALGEYLSHFGDWARSVQPFMDPVPTPDPLPAGVRWHVEALVMAYGSAEVRQLLERWGACAARIETADVVIRMADESRDPGALDQEALKQKHALEDYRKAMRYAADAIRDQMRPELAAVHPQRPGLETAHPPELEA